MIDNKRNILYVNAFSIPVRGSGADESLLLVIKALDKARYGAHVLYPFDGYLLDKAEDNFYLKEYERLGVKVDFMPMTRFYRAGSIREIARHAVCFLPATLKLVRLIRRENISLVHTNSASLPCSGLAARLTGRPSLYHVREEVVRPVIFRRLIAQMVNLLADKIVCISNAVASMFLDSGVPSEKVMTIYNCVDLEEFDPRINGDSFRAELGISPDAPLVGMVGRISPRKGHRYFLHAARLVSEVMPQARFVIVGDIESRIKKYTNLLAELKCLVVELEIADKVIFTGARQDIPRVMAALDMLVLASCSEVAPEPFGRVLIEAMAMERPVVATWDGGVPEIVVDGTTGFLVPPRQPKPMARAILRLLKNRDMAREMGRAGRKRAEEMFTLPIQARRLSALYEELLSKR